MRHIRICRKASNLFLPDAITDELKTSRRELLELGNCIAPTIHRLVQDIQNSVS